MFLEVTLRRNPALSDCAAWLVRTARIEPNTYVIDLDQVRHNAAELRSVARRVEIGLYVMTKQFGRNPAVSRAIAETGLDEFVAVDLDEARVLWAHGLKVEHIGHLVGVPRCAWEEVVSHRPRHVTIFDVAQARALSASATGAPQEVLLRVYDESRFFHPGQAGGFRIEELPASLSKIRTLPGVRVVGVTAHPALSYSYDTGIEDGHGNFDLILDAADVLRGEGVSEPVVNAPGVTCCRTIPTLRGRGATYGEPGSSLIGQTPLHAFEDDPEVSSMVYATEISHRVGHRAFVFGGGFYARGHVRAGLVYERSASRHDSAVLCEAAPMPPGVIDYYGELIDPDAGCRVGDPAIYAFRSQVFVTRAHVAVVEGLGGQVPRLAGIWTATANLLQS